MSRTTSGSADPTCISSFLSATRKSGSGFTASELIIECTCGTGTRRPSVRSQVRLSADGHVKSTNHSRFQRILLRRKSKSANRRVDRRLTFVESDKPTVVFHIYRKNGEPAGVRTLDLLIKSQLLYQLSYRLSPSRFSMFYQHIEVSASQHRS